ncbi:MAG: ABC transporter permease [Opitutales bacterium]
MYHDLRFALRQIARHRWFSAAVIVTLALGIGINTTVFTLVNAVLFKPVPVPGGERLVVVTQYNPQNPQDCAPVSLPEFRAYREQNRTFAGLEGVSRDQAVISENGHPPERYQMGIVTPGLFGLLSTPPVLGRGFTAADGAAGAPPVVLLGHGVWQKRYGGAADVIGRTVRLNGLPATLIGVMPEGFKFPDNQDLWSAYAPTREREDIARRTREIGIRMALGATAGRVVRLMLGRGLQQLAVGLVLGLGGAFATTRMMDSILGLVSPTDPVVFGTVLLLLAGIGSFACWLPARRAARVAPTEALRAE